MGNGFPSHPNKSLWGFLHEMYDRQGVLGLLGATGANSWYVDGDNGNDNLDGRSLDTPKAKLSAVVGNAGFRAGDFIFVKPGRVTETSVVTLSRSVNNITIVGLGGRGAAFLQPSGSGVQGMQIDADDVTLINFGVAPSDNTANALIITGSRFRAFGCKLEGSGIIAIVGPGTAAQVSAGTKGTGGDGIFYDCEFCWSTNGVMFQSTDYGSATQWRIEKCLFHNIVTDCLTEFDGGGNGAGKDIWIIDNVFANQEDGTQPTQFIELDSANSTGLFAGNRCATTVWAAAKFAIATNVIFAGNFAQAEGPSTGGGTAGRPD